MTTEMETTTIYETFETAYSDNINDWYAYDLYAVESGLSTITEQLTAIVVLIGSILGVCLFRQLRK